jgi:hypothetical protein
MRAIVMTGGRIPVRLKACPLPSDHRRPTSEMLVSTESLKDEGNNGHYHDNQSYQINDAVHVAILQKRKTEA